MFPLHKVVVVQSLSRVWLFVTPWTGAHQVSLTSTVSQSLLKFMSFKSVMLSNHFILCCPLLLLPSIFLSIRVCFNELALQIRWPKYWSFSISPSNEYIQDWLPLGLIGLISWLSKGFSRVFSRTTIQKHQFFGTQPFIWFNSHICIWLLEKPLHIRAPYFEILDLKMFHWNKNIFPLSKKCQHSPSRRKRDRVGFSFVIISNAVNFWMAAKLVLKIASLSFADKVIDGDCQNSKEVIIKKSWGIVANTNLILENYVGNFPGGPAVRTLSFHGRGHRQPKIKKERKVEKHVDRSKQSSYLKCSKVLFGSFI